VYSLVSLVLVPAPLMGDEPELATLTPEAGESLVKIADAYKKLECYGDQGQIRIALKVGEREVKRERRTPLQFCRPNKFAVDYGALAMFSDGKTLLVYDFVHRNFYRQALARQLTVDAAALKGDDRKGNSQLLSYRGETYTEANNADQLLGALAGGTGGLVLTFLLEKDPIQSLRRGAKTTDVDPSGKFLRIAYTDGVELHLTPGEGGLLRRVSLVLNAETLAKAVPATASVKELALAWESGAISTAKATVQPQMEEQVRRLKNRAEEGNLKLFKEMDTTTADKTLAPVPPAEPESWVELIRKFWKKFFG
jgi:hypothetical protein